MAEYIEREALMRRIKEIHCAECDSYHGVRCRACWVDDTLDYIDSEPAADVVQARHGHWSTINQIATGLPWKYRCNDCGCPQEYTHNYCPNCGARMDGGDGNDDAE